jgi:hypothetical protein
MAGQPSITLRSAAGHTIGGLAGDAVHRPAVASAGFPPLLAAHVEVGRPHPRVPAETVALLTQMAATRRALPQVTLVALAAD